MLQRVSAGEPRLKFREHFLAGLEGFCPFWGGPNDYQRNKA
jgi:hypothetical protein